MRTYFEKPRTRVGWKARVFLINALCSDFIRKMH